jgi:hypothetical protein
MKRLLLIAIPALTMSLAAQTNGTDAAVPFADAAAAPARR